MCCCCCSMKQRNSSQQPQRDQSFRSQNEKWKKPFRSNTISRTRYIVFCTEDVNFEKKAKATKHIPPPFVVVLVVIEREKKSAFVCVFVLYNVLLLLKKRVEMREIRMCVVFCLQMKKKSDFFNQKSLICFCLFFKSPVFRSVDTKSTVYHSETTTY